MWARSSLRAHRSQDPQGSGAARSPSSRTSGEYWTLVPLLVLARPPQNCPRPSTVTQQVDLAPRDTRVCSALDRPCAPCLAGAQPQMTQQRTTSGFLVGVRVTWDALRQFPGERVTYTLADERSILGLVRGSPRSLVQSSGSACPRGVVGQDLPPQTRPSTDASASPRPSAPESVATAGRTRRETH